jgi:hypothetical protein
MKNEEKTDTQYKIPIESFGCIPNSTDNKYKKNPMLLLNTPEIINLIFSEALNLMLQKIIFINFKIAIFLLK